MEASQAVAAPITPIDTASASDDSVVRVVELGTLPYAECYARMRRFHESRDANTPDEIWLVQHPPVYTLGLAGKAEHLLRDTGIPLAHTDRGGQITYHGPGQVVAYTLIDLARRGIKVRAMVHRLEQSVIDLCEHYEVCAVRRPGAPGVYVGEAKIAALGLRVRNGRCYHGLALNVDMDLRPFENINPCGYAGLRVAQLRDLGVSASLHRIESELATELSRHIVS